MPMVKTLPEFDEWLGSIKDPLVRARLLKRLDKVTRGAMGDVKALRDGVYEMREDFGKGWRMYFVQRGDVFVIMLGGGSKSGQQADIQAAVRLARTIKE